jgi:LemA protein
MKKFIALGCLGIALLFGLILLIAGTISYNGLVGKSQAVDGAWGQVENVYQRRADLIPNLVSTVSAEASFEKSTLTAVTEARASVGRVTIDASHAPEDAKTLKEFQQAQGQLSTALSRMLMVTEQYPQLRANEGFRTLQAQLEGTENRIAVERERFNEATRVYNTAVHSFPSVLFAGMFGYHDKPYFAASEAAQTAPTVTFPDFNKK